MSLKKAFLAVLAVVVAAGLVLVVIKIVSPKTRSRIINAETKIIRIERDGKKETVVQPPSAELAAAEEKRELSSLEGTVVRVPNNPADTASLLMTALQKDNETIVLTNITYVHSLEYFYLGKKVRLKGEWRKDAIIFGKKYRSFWIEDMQLL